MPRRSLAILTLLLIIATPALAGRRIVPSSDRVPLGDWTYDAMVSLASDGLIPGYSARLFEGDRLFNRYEMAQVVALIIRSTGDTTLGTKQTVLVDHLIAEFRPELMYVDEESIGIWSDRSNITPSAGPPAFALGYVRGALTENTAEDAELAVPYHLSGFAQLSHYSFAAATVSDKDDKFFQQSREDRALTKYFIRGVDGTIAWAVGRQPLNWGPAYSGSVILSDNSPAFGQVYGSREIDFGKILGRFKITQFGTTFEDNGARAYFAGRRYERPFRRNWHFGISEAAKMRFRPNPLIAVMPFYLYQHIFNESDVLMNNVYSTDLTYLSDNGMEAYGELVIDDMTSTRLLGKAGTRPRKTGFVGGLYLPKVLSDDRLSTFRAEYITIDRLTYGATREEFPDLAYTHDRAIIGSPVGQNAKAIYLRGERYFTDKFSAIGEYYNQWQTASGDPERGHQQAISLMAAYDFRPDTSISLRVAPFKVTPPGEPSESGTKYELRASFGF